MKAFFIVGVQRSGTTLLSVMLEKHPTILMEKRVMAFRIITCFKNLYDLLPFNLKHDKKALTAWMIKNDEKGRLASLIDYENIEHYDSIRDLIQSSIDKKTKAANKTIWGDKAPNLQHYINDLLLLIPEAKILHIVRDGRANAYSMSNRSYRNLELSAQQWVDGNIFGLVNQQTLGSHNYKLVKYEKLLTNPEEEAKGICDFLDIQYAPEMINLSDEKLDREESYVKNFFDQSKIDKWKGQLSTNEIRKIENIQGPLLKELGYELQTEESALKFKLLSLRRQIWYNQKDNLNQLFQRKRIGMKDKEMVELNLPFKNRAYNFLRFLARDLLSFSIFKALFPRFFYKEKIFKEEDTTN